MPVDTLLRGANLRTLAGRRVASAGRSGANSVVRWLRGVDVRKRSRPRIEVGAGFVDGLERRTGESLLVGTREDRNLLAELERKGVDPSWPGAGRGLEGVLLKLMMHRTRVGVSVVTGISR